MPKVRGTGSGPGDSPPTGASKMVPWPPLLPQFSPSSSHPKTPQSYSACASPELPALQLRQTVSVARNYRRHIRNLPPRTPIGWLQAVM
jgi:hypothetical protein